MTVQELINELNEIEDKTIPVGRYVGPNRDGPPTLCLANDVYVEIKNVYDFKKGTINTYDNVTFAEIKFKGLWSSDGKSY